MRLTGLCPRELMVLTERARLHQAHQNLTLFCLKMEA